MLNKLKIIFPILSALFIGYFAYAYNKISGFNMLFLDSKVGEFYLNTYRVSLYLGIFFILVTVLTFLIDIFIKKRYNHKGEGPRDSVE